MIFPLGWGGEGCGHLHFRQYDGRRDHRACLPVVLCPDVETRLAENERKKPVPFLAKHRLPLPRRITFVTWRNDVGGADIHEKPYVHGVFGR